jgi:hypothetical protein
MFFLKKKILFIGRLGLVFILFLVFIVNSFSQNLNSNSLYLQEITRREQLVGNLETRYSFGFRNYELKETSLKNDFPSIGFFKSRDSSKVDVKIISLPITQTLQFNNNRPIGWADGPMIPNVGFQYYVTSGIFVKVGFLNVQLQPEFVAAQNKSYQGFSDSWPSSVIRSRFFDLNNGDFPERFGKDSFSDFWWGQSKVTAQFGAFELGASTQNLWWGPGQWNALTFSNNAKGFPHLTFNSFKPARTFIGNFEGQLIIGRLENSGLGPNQSDELNKEYFRPFNGDWRYLNAMLITYNPKWFSGLHLGFTRTFQQYDSLRGNSFSDYFPVFSPFQKVRVGFDKDSEGRDQQLSLFFRWVFPKILFEFYGEFGRRDHALNWREAILNPEHARAYIIGFNKLFKLNMESKFIQLRAEITHQQESINRYIRNDGIGLTWHTHTRARGFVNYGQPLGVGIGVGSNIQTLEISKVNKFNKIGLLFERIENHQDFFYRTFTQNTGHQPWVDLSLGLLIDYRWKNFVLNSSLKVVNGMNYQWQLEEKSISEFPKGKNLSSFHSNFTIIYLFNQYSNNKK